MKNCKKEFDAFNDMQILVGTGNYCSVRTGKLLDTLMFMQDRGRRLQETLEDDEYINGKRVEFNILSFSKIPLKIEVLSDGNSSDGEILS